MDLDTIETVLQPRLRTELHGSRTTTPTARLGDGCSPSRSPDYDARWNWRVPLANAIRGAIGAPLTATAFAPDPDL